MHLELEHNLKHGVMGVGSIEYNEGRRRGKRGWVSG
jgi:hypothetical protein